MPESLKFVTPEEHAKLTEEVVAYTIASKLLENYGKNGFQNLNILDLQNVDLNSEASQIYSSLPNEIEAYISDQNNVIQNAVEIFKGLLKGFERAQTCYLNEMLENLETLLKGNSIPDSGIKQKLEGLYNQIDAFVEQKAEEKAQKYKQEINERIDKIQEYKSSYLEELYRQIKNLENEINGIENEYKNGTKGFENAISELDGKENDAQNLNVSVSTNISNEDKQKVDKELKEIKKREKKRVLKNIEEAKERIKNQEIEKYKAACKNEVEDFFTTKLEEAGKVLDNYNNGNKSYGDAKNELEKIKDEIDRYSINNVNVNAPSGLDVSEANNEIEKLIETRKNYVQSDIENKLSILQLKQLLNEHIASGGHNG